jgi:hypothetical protein
LLGRVFGALAGVAEGAISSGNDALKERLRDGEGGGALGSVEDAKTSAGACSYIEETASLLEAFGDRVHRDRDIWELGCDCGGHLLIFFVNQAKHLEGGKPIYLLGGGIAGLSGQSGEIHDASMMGVAARVSND